MHTLSRTSSAPQTAALEIKESAEQREVRIFKEKFVVNDVDTYKIAKLVEKDMPQIQEARNKEVNIVIGKTGAGKSTMIKYFAGCEFSVIDGQNVKVTKTVAGKLPDSMDGRLSATLSTIPYDLVQNNIPYTFVDTAGFDGDRLNDNDRFFESISTQVFTRNCRKVKSIVVAIESGSLNVERGRLFKILVKTLGKLLNASELSNQNIPVSFVITKTDTKELDNPVATIDKDWKTIEDCKEKNTARLKREVEELKNLQERLEYLRQKLATLAEKLKPKSLITRIFKTFRGKNEEDKKQEEEHLKNLHSKELLEEERKLVEQKIKEKKPKVLALKKASEIYNLINKENLFLLDISRGESRNQILRHISSFQPKQPHALQSADGKEQKPEIFDFSEYDSKRMRFDQAFTVQVNQCAEVLSAFQENLERIKRNDYHIADLCERVENNTKRLDFINSEDYSIIDKKGRIASLEELKNSCIKSLKEGEEKIKDYRTKITIAKEKIKEIDPEELQDWIWQGKRQIEKRYRVFGIISYTTWNISYDNQRIPFQGKPIINNPTRSTIDVKMCEPHAGIYEAVYTTDYGNDGDLEIVFKIKKGDIPSNKLRLNELEREISELELHIKDVEEYREKIDKLDKQIQTEKGTHADASNLAEEEVQKLNETIEAHNKAIAKLQRDNLKLQQSHQRAKVIIDHCPDYFVSLSALSEGLGFDTTPVGERFKALFLSWHAKAPLPAPIIVSHIDEVKESAEELFQSAYDLEKGMGIKMDLGKAFKYYQRAANLDHPAAGFRVGRCYELAIGVNKDDEKARGEYNKAYKLLASKSKKTDQDFYYLGRCYELGKGTYQNDSMAIAAYQEAAKLNFKPALYRLAVCHQLKSDKKPKNKNDNKWYEAFSASDSFASYTSEQRHMFLERENEGNVIAVARSSTVLALDLRDRIITPKMAKNLACFLKLNNRIKSINLNGARFENLDCLTVIFEALSFNRSIVEMDISRGYFINKIRCGELPRTLQDNYPNHLRNNKLRSKPDVPLKEIIESKLLRRILNDAFTFAEDEKEAKEMEELVAFKNSLFVKNNANPLTPLHVAAMSGRRLLIEPMLQLFSIDALDKYQHTPLEYAAGFGHLSTVAELLDLGAAGEDDYQSRRTLFKALQFAIKGNHHNVVELLLLHPLCNPALQSDDEIGDSILHTAARYNSITVLRQLVVNPKLSSLSLNKRNKQGLSPSYVAAFSGSLETLEFLLKQGVDINSKSKPPIRQGDSPADIPQGLSVLDCAVLAKQTSVIEWLVLKGGARIETQTENLAKSDVEIARVLDHAKRRRHHLETKMKNKLGKLSHIRNIVIKGGGVKGIGHIGAFLGIWKSAAEGEGPAFFKNLKRVAGTSAGAINGFLLAIGYTPPEMKKIVLALQFKELMDSEDQGIVTKFIDSVNQGVSVDETLATIAGPAREVFRHGAEAIGAGRQGIKHVATGRYASAALQITKSSAYGIVTVAEGVKNFTHIKKTLSGAASILEKAKNNFGIFPGVALVDLLKLYLAKKGLAPDITFKELHELHKANPEVYKELYIVATNLTQGHPQVFSHEETPDVLIIDAIRASMSIPLFFRPHKIHQKKDGNITLFSNDDYVDGGMIMNYPIGLFDRRRYLEDEGMVYQDGNSHVHNDETLGFSLVTHQEFESLSDPGRVPEPSAPIEGIYQYTWRLVSLYANSEDILHKRSDDRKRTVYINSIGVSTVDFALREDKQSGLLATGENGWHDFSSNAVPKMQVYTLNNELRASLQRYGESRYVLDSERGLNFEQFKVSVTRPSEIFDVLQHVNNDDELAFVKKLPIDFNYRDEYKRTVLLYALQLISQNDNPTAEKVIEHLIALGKTMIDFSARDSDNKSVADYVEAIANPILAKDLQVALTSAGIKLHHGLADRKEKLDRVKNELDTSSRSLHYMYTSSSSPSSYSTTAAAVSSASYASSQSSSSGSMMSSNKVKH